MTNCYLCGSAVRLVREERELTIGQRSAVVDHEFFVCDRCEEEYVLPEQMDAIQRRASTAIRRREGLLLPKEIRKLRERYHLTQDALERLLGGGPKTVVRWEKGTVFQNKTVDNLLRVVREFPEVAKWLANRNGVELRHEPSLSATLSAARGIGLSMHVVGGAELATTVRLGESYPRLPGREAYGEAERAAERPEPVPGENFTLAV